MNTKKIILASSSPRRIEMIQKNNGDAELVIMPPNVEEILPAVISMEQAVMFLALKKALSIEKELVLKENPFQDKTYENAVIIAADTVVYKNRIIGKPTSREDAVEIFHSLRDTNHYVATGIALICPHTLKRKVFCEVTEVFFKCYTDLDISQYLSTDEPWDKAGGYAIQGAWGKHIDHIQGDYENVVGFPWNRIKKELAQF